MQKPLGISAAPRCVRACLFLAYGCFFPLLLLAASHDKPRGMGKISSPAAVTQRAMRLMHDQCLSCHNEEKKKGGLTMHSRAALLKGSDNGKVVSAGKPEASLLFQALQAEADPHMPPKTQLTTNQIELVRRWIAGGLKWDEAALRGEARGRDVKLEALPPGHAPTLALALAPDGRWLAAGRGNRIAIYDTLKTNFPVVAEFEAHRDEVRALAWSPDGSLLASGAYRELTVWETNSFQARWTVRTSLVDRVTALRFSAYGGALVAADSAVAERGWVRLFAVETGRPLAAWPAHTDTIYDLAISSDGGVIATAGGDKLAKLWEVASSREVARLEGHAGSVSGLAFNTNGTELVTVGADKQLKVWDVKTRESAITLGARKQGFNAVAWSADGGTIATVDEGGCLVRLTNLKRHNGEQSSNPADERELGRWPEPLHAVAVSAEGKRFFAGGQDGTIFVVNADKKILATLKPSAPAASPVVAGSISAQAPTRPPGPAGDAGTGGNGEPVPSFLHDVLPLLSKAGCSAGACHAKPEGQNGFKLSVFNYDPKSDYAEIVKEGRGRRVFPAAPEESLVLLKPTLAVEHGGGQRFERGSETYQTLLRWIRGGMIYQHPDEPLLVQISVEPQERRYKKGTTQPLTVTAHYTDGSKRDVTSLADYAASDRELAAVDDQGRLRVGQLSGESAVVARFLGFVDAARITVPAERILPEERYRALPVNNFIDALADAQFRKLGLFPSELCTDAEFLRRASLDSIGVLPSADETRAFLADAAPDKRRRWIDNRLAQPAYADYWANKWADLLRPNPDRVGVKSVFTLDQWLREAFRTNQPYNEFARAIILAEGSNHRDGPVVVYRDRREPIDLTTMFSQLFLGVRLECAKCHHHPNEKWSQDDFYQFAAFFGPLKRKGAGLSPPISAGTESFYFAPGGTVKHPVTDEVMQPRPPDGPLADARAANDPRRALADWLTAPRNPFFARAAVNRVWAAVFGRGFVEPVDDFRASNPIANEPLLNALAEDFATHQYDLKHLLRTILQSRLYQLSSMPNEFNLADTKNFSRSYRRRLPAEVLSDAVSDVTGLADEYQGTPPGTRALQTWSYKISSHFLDTFGRPNASSDCPCDRDLHTSVVQSLHLMNAKTLQAKLTSPEGQVARLAASSRTPREIVTELYLATFNRPPQDLEITTASAAFTAPGATRQTATEDVLWALLNSPEFVFNH